MNAQSQESQKAHAEHLAHLEHTIEIGFFRLLKTKYGRTVVAWMVRGTHNLGHVYVPGMTFDQVAFEAGKQYDARELIRIIRRSERCSTLFDQALREYDNEWSQPASTSSTGTGSTSAG